MYYTQCLLFALIQHNNCCDILGHMSLVIKALNNSKIVKRLAQFSKLLLTGYFEFAISNAHC